jgi:hypothetical protein
MNKPNTTYTFGMSGIFHKGGNKVLIAIDIVINNLVGMQQDITAD